MNPTLPKSWHVLYLLKSKLTEKVYMGCNGDLRKKLKEHNDKKVFSTKKLLPVELFYFEAYKYKETA